MLLLKAASLLAAAEDLRPEALWTWMAGGLGVVLGGMKARFLFVKSCRKNLDRIYNLKSPQIWQFYRPIFFLMLTLMISLGATLSQLAQGDYVFLLGVATLDLSIGIALFGSSYTFWKYDVVEVQNR